MNKRLGFTATSFWLQVAQTLVDSDLKLYSLIMQYDGNIKLFEINNTK